MGLTVKTFKTFTGPGVVEGAGGLHVPLDSRHDVIDLLRAVQLPVIVIARAGLGTINHSTLTLNALLAAGLHPVALVLNHATPGKPDASVRDNRAELQRRFTRVPILGPVPFQARESARTRAFEQVLTELIENRLRR